MGQTYGKYKNLRLGLKSNQAITLYCISWKPNKLGLQPELINYENRRAHIFIYIYIYSL